MKNHMSGKNVKFKSIVLGLGEITQVHNRVVELNSQHPIDSYYAFSPGDISKEVIKTLLITNPVIVRRSNKKYECVGNNRIFSLAKSILSQSTTINVSELIDKKLTTIEDIFWAERLYSQVILDLGPKKNHRLIELWHSCLESNLGTRIGFPNAKTKAKFKKFLKR